jgi:REP element-mobilizing transposase RayT
MTCLVSRLIRTSALWGSPSFLNFRLTDTGLGLDLCRLLIQRLTAVQGSRKAQLDRNFQVSGTDGTRDRRRYLHWIFEAKKRFGLSVLNFMITSNHVHLLIKVAGPNVIAYSMQLIACRTAQEYNQRKGRQRAFWEDRYHATAIEADEHLHRCLIYIDLNMGRAGVLGHPAEWAHSGYRKIQEPPKRYAVIDLQEQAALCGFTDRRDFQRAHRQWVEQALERTAALRATIVGLKRSPLGACFR